MTDEEFWNEYRAGRERHRKRMCKIHGIQLFLVILLGAIYALKFIGTLP